MAVDIGFQTSEVYKWARQQGPGRVLPVKGRQTGTAPIWPGSTVDVVGGKRVKRGLKPWHVATGMLKSELYGWLKLERPTEEGGDPFPPGYCHFPQLPEEFFKQLTAEQLVTKIVKGYRKPEWVCMRERNEALDTRVYARAAASQFGIDRFSESRWRDFESALGVSTTPSKAKQTAQKPGTDPQISRDSFRPILPDDPYL